MLLRLGISYFLLSLSTKESLLELYASLDLCESEDIEDSLYTDIRLEKELEANWNTAGELPPPVIIE